MKGSRRLFGLALVGFLFKLNMFEIIVGTWERSIVLECLGVSNKFFVVGSSWENLKKPLYTLLVHTFTTSKPTSILGLWEY